MPAVETASVGETDRISLYVDNIALKYRERDEEEAYPNVLHPLTRVLFIFFSLLAYLSLSLSLE